MTLSRSQKHLELQLQCSETGFWRIVCMRTGDGHLAVKVGQMFCWHNPHKVQWELSFLKLEVYPPTPHRWETNVCLPCNLPCISVASHHTALKMPTQCRQTAIAFHSGIRSHVIMVSSRSYTAKSFICCSVRGGQIATPAKKPLTPTEWFLWILS